MDETCLNEIEVIEEKEPTSEKIDRKVVRNAIDLQRIKLEKLMKNPDKPIVIPEIPKEKDFIYSVPTFVRNVMGSSAGAGSGEFHVYRNLRRKEYARQKIIEVKSYKECLDKEYRDKIEKNRLDAQAKTAKKRAKRLKKKERQKNNKKVKVNTETNKNNDDDEDFTESNDESEKESDEEKKETQSEIILDKEKDLEKQLEIEGKTDEEESQNQCDTILNTEKSQEKICKNIDVEKTEILSNEILEKTDETESEKDEILMQKEIQNSDAERNRVKFDVISDERKKCEIENETKYEAISEDENEHEKASEKIPKDIEVEKTNTQSDVIFGKKSETEKQSEKIDEDFNAERNGTKNAQYEEISEEENELDKSSSKKNEDSNMNHYKSKENDGNIATGKTETESNFELKSNHCKQQYSPKRQAQYETISEEESEPDNAQQKKLEHSDAKNNTEIDMILEGKNETDQQSAENNENPDSENGENKSSNCLGSHSEQSGKEIEVVKQI